MRGSWHLGIVVEGDLERFDRGLHAAPAAAILGGLVKCGHCGKALVGHDANGGKFRYYVCGSILKAGTGPCPARYLPAEKFE